MADKIGFAYSFWDGEYGVREGVVYPVHYDNSLSFFRFGEDSCTIVTSEPGVMANNIVWFEKPNEHAALNLLMVNEHRILYYLENELKVHNEKSKTLIYRVEELLKEETNEQ